MVSVPAVHVCHYSVMVDIDDLEMNRYGSVSINVYLQKQVADKSWLVNHGLVNRHHPVDQ